VRPGSFADEIGLERGFVIAEINKHPVADEASYRAVVSALKSGDDVAFAVRTPNGGASGPSLFGGTLP
jgi:serine protease Do